MGVSLFNFEVQHHYFILFTASPRGIRTRTIVSKVMSVRTVVSLLRRNKSSKLSTNIDVKRYCVGMTTLYEQTSGDTLRENLVNIIKDQNSKLNLEIFKEDIMDYCSSSVIISWAISEYGDNTQIPPREILNLERAMKQSYIMTTLRPFFVLDGGGRIMVFLSLLGH